MYKEVRKVGLSRGGNELLCSHNREISQSYRELWSPDGPSELSWVEQRSQAFVYPHWLQSASKEEACSQVSQVPSVKGNSIQRRSQLWASGSANTLSRSRTGLQQAYYSIHYTAILWSRGKKKKSEPEISMSYICYSMDLNFNHLKLYLKEYLNWLIICPINPIVRSSFRSWGPWSEAVIFFSMSFSDPSALRAFTCTCPLPSVWCTPQMWAHVLLICISSYLAQCLVNNVPDKGLSNE